jgi:hypothetical protein
MSYRWMPGDGLIKQSDKQVVARRPGRDSISQEENSLSDNLNLRERKEIHEAHFQ